MDLRFTDEENKFRDHLRSVFLNDVPAAIRKRVEQGQTLGKAEYVAVQKILHAKNLAVPHWPKEWGGLDWTPIQNYIYTEEMQTCCVPPPMPFNVSMVGPVIYTFGTEAQKKQFLPDTASMDLWWCQGFSEPGAGSDLAGLKTTAVRQGDDYIINGQKTWTTLAQYADWIFVLARTDPEAKKQLGISFILVDMKTPGITVRPIQTLDGGKEINEVFFDDVKVPVANLVGQEHRGWDCAKYLLSNERVGIARVGTSKQRIARVKYLASKVSSGDRPLIEDPRFREKVAAVEVELKALEMSQLRILADERTRRSNMPNPASSILKIKGSDIQQATTELLVEVAGPLAVPFMADNADNADHPDAWASTHAPQYFNNRKVSIYGGSNEIQRNILAKAVLGF